MKEGLSNEAMLNFINKSDDSDIDTLKKKFQKNKKKKKKQMIWRNFIQLKILRKNNK